MRILHLVPYFPPERLGGVGEFIAGLHGSLLEAGHDSQVITTGLHSTDSVHRIARTPLAWFFKSAWWARQARAYDIVHAQAGEALPALILIRLLRRRPGILTTFHVSFVGISKSHRPYVIEGRSFARGLRPLFYRTVVSWLHRFLDWMTIRLSDDINAISIQSARDVLGKKAETRIPTVYYGLPRSPAPSPEGELPPVDILYAGSGGHRKRIVALPFILRKVRETVPGATMTIVGFTPESEPEVESLFEELGLRDEVHFCGVKTSAELTPYYRAARVMVVPSAYEGLPFVILEAFRSGLPVVATDVSGHPEAITHGENGFLVSLDQPEEMALYCVRILQDEALRRRLGAAAHATFLARFGMDRQLREYLSLYQRTIERLNPE